jgi:hypothetical protein
MAKGLIFNDQFFSFEISSHSMPASHATNGDEYIFHFVWMVDVRVLHLLDVKGMHKQHPHNPNASTSNYEKEKLKSDVVYNTKHHFLYFCEEVFYLLLEMFFRRMVQVAGW